MNLELPPIFLLLNVVLDREPIKWIAMYILYIYFYYNRYCHGYYYYYWLLSLFNLRAAFLSQCFHCSFDKLKMSNQSLTTQGTVLPFSHKSVLSITHEQNII